MSETAKDGLLGYLDASRDWPEEYNSEFSETIKVQSAKDVQPPEAPTGLVATERVGKVTLRWDENTEDDFEKYKVYAGTTGSFATPAAETDTTGNTRYDYSTENYGTAFAFRVSAIDYTENESDLTTEVTGSPQKAGTSNVTPDVRTASLATNSVDSKHIVDTAVITDKLAASAVNDTKIAASAVTTNKVTAGAINSVKLAASAVVANKIAANAVGVNKLSVGTLSAITANMGTLTAGRAYFAGGNVVVGNNAVGTSDGIYVSSGGKIQVTDTDGATIFNSSSQFQGARLITSGRVATSNGEDEIAEDLGSITISSGKKWIVMGSQGYAAANDSGMNIAELDYMDIHFGAYFNDDGGANTPTLSSGSYSDTQVLCSYYIELIRDDNTTFHFYGDMIYMVWEVPA